MVNRKGEFRRSSIAGGPPQAWLHAAAGRRRDRCSRRGHRGQARQARKHTVEAVDRPHQGASRRADLAHHGLGRDGAAVGGRVCVLRRPTDDGEGADLSFSPTPAIRSAASRSPSSRPQAFSFNSPLGHVRGLQRPRHPELRQFDPELVPCRTKRTLTIDEGAIEAVGRRLRSQGVRVAQLTASALASPELKIDLEKPLAPSSRRTAQRQVLYGTGATARSASSHRLGNRSGAGTFARRWEGVIPGMMLRGKDDQTSEAAARAGTGSSSPTPSRARPATARACAPRAARCAIAEAHHRRRLRADGRRGGGHFEFDGLALEAAGRPRSRSPSEVLKEIRERGSSFLSDGGPRLPLPGPFRARPSRAARPSASGWPARSAPELTGRHLHPRRALDRAASARQPAAARDAARPHARHREHGRGRRARRGHDPCGGPRDRLRPGRRASWAARSSTSGTPKSLERTRSPSPARTSRAAASIDDARRATEAVVRSSRLHQVQGARGAQPEGRSTSSSRSDVLTAVTGVSGAGKSTLVNDILYPGALAAQAPRVSQGRAPAPRPGHPRARRSSTR